ncbi:prealbumin-like fold domain-containing protein, partial [Stenotrophomonas maltophilia group sp. RNC7]|uniref:prealbumin-like fold domain-containing protein n=1 Tax=Stenotrophomonas maltophilia group sp. RNC7 TaxID=3071467 RepID=UPI0027E0AFE8
SGTIQIVVNDTTNTIETPDAVASTITNEKIHQAVKLVKVDDATGEGLAGVVFTLHHVNDNSQVTTDENNEPLGILATKSTGELVVNNLPPGQYYFKEVTPPQYYPLPQGDAAKSVNFTIAPGQTTQT